jgi:hypothetical protein
MQQDEPAGQRELQRDRGRDGDCGLPAGLALRGAFPGGYGALTRALSFAVAGAFRAWHPALELIKPAVQRADAVENQRAVRGRVTRAIVRFRPLMAGKILPGLIIFAGFSST